MSVATPPRSNRPLAEPDWARWEADLSGDPLDAGNPGPPDPPLPPTGGNGDGDGGGGEGRPGDDRRKVRHDLTWLRVLFGTLAVLVVATFFLSQQTPRQLPPGEPKPPAAESLAEASHRSGVMTDRLDALMNVPPSADRQR